MADIFEITGRIHSTSQEHVATVADEILDETKGKKQSQVNAETDATLAEHTSTINGLNSQNYVTVTATDQTTAVTDVLPATGEVATVYRVGNWDGSQFDASVYSEYAWNGSSYVHLNTKTQVGEVFDISVYHATGSTLATYADLSAALDSNNGGGVPQSLQRGGMSVKFVHTSDNKYVQWRYMGTAVTGTPNPFLDTANWQGVDENITLDSHNLAESGAVYDELAPLKEKIDGFPAVAINLSDYELVNGYFDDEYFRTAGNYGLYQRCKFVPISSTYKGRTITITRGQLNTYFAVLKSMPDISQQLSELDFATGYNGHINIAPSISPYDIVVPADGNYLAFYITDTRTTNDFSPSSVVVKAVDSAFYTKQEVDAELAQIDEALGNRYTKSEDDALLATKADNSTVDSLEERIDDIEDDIYKPITVDNKYPFQDIMGRYDPVGKFVADTDFRGVVVIPIRNGAAYNITTVKRSTLIPCVIYTSDETVTAGQDLTTVLGTEYTGDGTEVTIQNQPLTIPSGTTYIIAQTNYIRTDEDICGVFESYESGEIDVYTKEDSDERYALKATVDSTNKVYGVRWSISDINDEGERCFASIGLNAAIGIGTDNGSSDFDNIYPWSEMKRCNIKTNANGAKIVTFEGETGFVLDGSNGDVFVRIPKFRTNRYDENGKMYITIGDGYVHPAFIENGVELDEIFVGALEASITDNALYSKGGVIPANNLTPVQFLAAAKARGNNYTLFDMRSIDAIWRLMAVEYGKRNSNRILGWGYSDFWQPVDRADMKSSAAVTQSNIITLGKPSSNAFRLRALANFSPGNNICICDGTQTNIVAQRKVTNVQCASVDDNLVITFDGEPIDITTTMFVGNAPCDCNYCETIDNAYKLNWHTGRANREPSYDAINIATYNPCRYRWIENPVGNVWHYLPDVRFNTCQMYVCDNMLQYDFESFTNYKAIGGVLPEQSNNGNKGDVNTVENPNFWITALMNDVFSKGNGFAKSFDTVHDGTLTSQKGYGGYYYLYNNSNNIITHGGGYDHLWRCNMLTFRAWQTIASKWYLYGARLMYKNLD